MGDVDPDQFSHFCIFAGFTAVIDRLHASQLVTISHIYIHSTAMHTNNNYQLILTSNFNQMSHLL